MSHDPAVGAAGRNPAPTLLSADYLCGNCNNTVDVQEVGIKCRDCGCWFHAIDCGGDEFSVSAHTLFATLKNARNVLAGLPQVLLCLFFL